MDKILPVLGDTKILDRPSFQPAGDHARQRDMNALSWTMVTVAPDGQGRQATRLDRSWLRDHGWALAVMAPEISDDGEERLCQAIQRRGVGMLMLAIVSPGMAEPAAVFSFPPEPVALNNALKAVPGLYAAIFPEDRSFLILAAMDGYIAIAGRRDFVREAVEPDEARAGLAEVVALSRASPVGDWFAPELAHYRPFLLEGP